jgi:hypothetical protein
MPWFRFQIRALMAVVALIAVATGLGVGLKRRSESFRGRAYYHNAVSHQLKVEAGFSFCSRGARLASRTAERELQMAASEYHRLLGLKYQTAAALPWYPVSSDPPPPPLANPKLVSADDY